MMPAATVAIQRGLILPACFVVLIGCLTASLGGAENDAADRPIRTWTDSTGTYSVAASFVEYQDGSVLLQNPDGGEISVALDRLSSTDRSYVRSEVRRNALAARRKPRTELRTKQAAHVGRLPGEDDRATAAGRAAATQRLYGIDWHDSPASALAAVEADQQKPVLWFRVLGDLDGFM